MASNNIKDKTKRKKRHGEDGADSIVCIEDNCGASHAEQTTQKERKGTKRKINAENSIVDNTREKTQKKNEKKRKFEEDNSSICSDDSSSSNPDVSEAKEKERNDFNSEDSDNLASGDLEKQKQISANLRKKMKYQENQTITKLLKQRTNVGCEMQVQRIKSVCDEVSYDSVMEELVGKLKKKMAKRVKLQENGKVRKIEKLDGKVEVLKEEAAQKASELNNDAVKKLETIQLTIMKKMKKKRRKKRLTVRGMAEERFSKGKKGLGTRCKKGEVTLQANSTQANYEIKQAVEETKAELNAEMVAFKQRIQRLDATTMENAMNSVFAGAGHVTGYLC